MTEVREVKSQRSRVDGPKLKGGSVSVAAIEAEGFERTAPTPFDF